MAGEPVDLAGWHLAFAMTYGDVNLQIASIIQKLRTDDPTRYPATLNRSVSSGGSQPVLTTVTGDLAPWGLVAGGRQDAVKIGIRIDNAIVSIGTTKNFAGTISITIDGRLSIDADNKISVVRPTVTGSPYTFDYSGLDPVPTALDDRIPLNAALDQWLDGLWDLFGSELMSVDPVISPPAGVDPADWAWLSPQKSRAVVSEIGISADEHQFIVVSMTGGATPPTAVTLAGSLIPVGARFGISIAAGVFLENIIKKGLPLTFLKTPSDQFTVVDKRLSANGPINVPQFQFDDKHTVNATLTNTALEIAGEKLFFSFHIEFPYQQDNIHAVDVSLDLKLQYALSMSRKTVTVGGKEIPDFPLIQCDFESSNVTNIRVESTETFQILEWAISFGASLLLAIVATGASVYKWRSATAPAGQDAAEMDPVAGQAPPANAAQLNIAAAQADAAAADGDAPVMWGSIPRSAALSIGAIIGAFLVSAVLTGIPFWIYLNHSGNADKLVGSIDDAVKAILASYQLPDAAGEAMKVTSIGLNNSLLIGANPIS